MFFIFAIYRTLFTTHFVQRSITQKVCLSISLRNRSIPITLHYYIFNVFRRALRGYIIAGMSLVWSDPPHLKADARQSTFFCVNLFSPHKQPKT